MDGWWFKVEGGDGHFVHCYAPLSYLGAVFMFTCLSVKIVYEQAQNLCYEQTASFYIMSVDLKSKY